MFHVKHYLVFLFHNKLNVSRETWIEYNNLIHTIIKITFIHYKYHNCIILFLIANTAACVRSETSIFLKIFDI